MHEKLGRAPVRPMAEQARVAHAAAVDHQQVVRAQEAQQIAEGRVGGIA